MGMSTKATTATNLQKVIDENLVTITSVKVESKDEHKSYTITAEQFKSNLDNYIQSGIFTDSIDFKYDFNKVGLVVYAGSMSSYCDKCITAEFYLNVNWSKEDWEKVLRKVEED